MIDKILGAIMLGVTAFVGLAVVFAMAPALFKAQQQYDSAVESTSTGNPIVDFYKDHAATIGFWGVVTFLGGLVAVALGLRRGG